MAQQHLRLLGFRFDVSDLQKELAEHPEVWNEIGLRTRMYKNSPHREVDDIWVRYNPIKNFRGNWTEFNGDHPAEWYPVSHKLWHAAELAMDLAVLYECSIHDIGAVLITRVPSGKQVYPHSDGGWQAENHEKFIIQISSAPGQSFNFENEKLDARPGECYWFDNSAPHWVLNPTSEERISLIVCLRREKCHLVG